MLQAIFNSIYHCTITLLLFNSSVVPYHFVSAVIWVEEQTPETNSFRFKASLTASIWGRAEIYNSISSRFLKDLEWWSKFKVLFFILWGFYEPRIHSRLRSTTTCVLFAWLNTAGFDVCKHITYCFFFPFYFESCFVQSELGQVFETFGFKVVCFEIDHQFSFCLLLKKFLKKCKISLFLKLQMSVVKSVLGCKSWFPVFALQCFLTTLPWRSVALMRPHSWHQL